MANQQICRIKRAGKPPADRLAPDGMVYVSRGRVMLECSYCHEPFVTFLSVATRGPNRTCSPSCKTALFNVLTKRDRREMVCEQCANVFEVKRMFTTGPRRARFCSEACRNVFQRGERHPSWRGGKQVARRESRRIIARRVAEEGRCEECGSTDNLHGHHVKSFAEFPELRNEPGNIKVLCGACHADKHPHQARHLFSGVPRSGVDKTCPGCGLVFYVKRSHAPKRNTCSRNCWAHLRRSRGLAAALGLGK